MPPFRKSKRKPLSELVDIRDSLRYQPSQVEQEKVSVDWEHKSKNPGKVRSSGHDGHVAMLLGAAEMLQDHCDELQLHETSHSQNFKEVSTTTSTSPKVAAPTAPCGELPKNVFKKPKLKGYSSKSEEKQIYNPTFGKRKENNEPSDSQKNCSAGLEKSEGKKIYIPTLKKSKANNKASDSQKKNYSAEFNKSEGKMLQSPTFEKRNSEDQTINSQGSTFEWFRRQLLGEWGQNNDGKRMAQVEFNEEGETIRINVKNNPVGGTGMLSAAGSSGSVSTAGLPPSSSGTVKIRSPLPPPPNDVVGARVPFGVSGVELKGPMENARHTTDHLSNFSQMEPQSRVPMFGNWEVGHGVHYPPYFNKARRKYPDNADPIQAPLSNYGEPGVRVGAGVSKPKHECSDALGRRMEHHRTISSEDAPKKIGRQSGGPSPSSNGRSSEGRHGVGSHTLGRSALRSTSRGDETDKVNDDDTRGVDVDDQPSPTQLIYNMAQSSQSIDLDTVLERMVQEGRAAPCIAPRLPVESPAQPGANYDFEPVIVPRMIPHSPSRFVLPPEIEEEVLLENLKEIKRDGPVPSGVSLRDHISPPNGHLYTIRFDEIGKPVGPNAGKFSAKCGLYARMGHLFPLDLMWKSQAQSAKAMALKDLSGDVLFSVAFVEGHKKANGGYHNKETQALMEKVTSTQPTSSSNSIDSLFNDIYRLQNVIEDEKGKKYHGTYCTGVGSGVTKRRLSHPDGVYQTLTQSYVNQLRKEVIRAREEVESSKEDVKCARAEAEYERGKRVTVETNLKVLQLKYESLEEVQRSTWQMFVDLQRQFSEFQRKILGSRVFGLNQFDVHLEPEIRIEEGIHGSQSQVQRCSDGVHGEDTTRVSVHQRRSSSYSQG